MPHVEESKKDLVKDVHWLAHLGVRLADSPNGGFIVHHYSKSSLMVEVKSKKHLNPLLMDLKELFFWKMNESLSRGRWCS